MRFLLLFLLGCPTSPPQPEPGCVDMDGDGFTDCEDCDDTNALVFPGAEEICDGLDNNCDGVTLFEEEDGRVCADCQRAGFFPLTQQENDPTTELQEQSPGAECSYSTATRYMFTALDKVGGEVTCVYTGRTTAVGAEKPDPEDMNTEHTWPQSQGASSGPAKCDLHHLYPTDYDANATRADHPFGTVSTNQRWSDGGSRLGDNSGGQTVFEPRDIHKGNVARSMVYFATHYNHSLTEAEKTLYATWHAQDPVDDTERSRTLEIERRQGNINPFVVCPVLMELVTQPLP